MLGSSAYIIHITCGLVRIWPVVLIDFIRSIEVCLPLYETCSWRVVHGPLFSTHTFSGERGPVLESLVEGVSTTSTRCLPFNTDTLFLAERNVSLCCMLLKPSLAVRALDVVWVRSRRTLRGQGGT